VRPLPTDDLIARRGVSGSEEAGKSAASASLSAQSLSSTVQALPSQSQQANLNDSAVDYTAKNLCLHQLIEEQAAANSGSAGRRVLKDKNSPTGNSTRDRIFSPSI